MTMDHPAGRIVSLLLPVLSAVLLLGCHERPKIERSMAVTQKHPDAAAVVAAPGIIEPWGGETKLAALDSGVIAELAVTEGQAVRRGELLARLDDARQRHAVALAEAELRQAIAETEGTAPSAEEVRVARAELERAQHELEQRRRDAERAAQLGSVGVLPSAEVERAASTLRSDEAGVEAALARLAVVRRGARASERKLAIARHEAAVARLANAKTELTRREVRAPVDGVVLWSRYHAGEFYAPAVGPLMMIGSLERLQVRAEVDDTDATSLQQGATCMLRGDGGEALGEGIVIRIAVESATRQLPSERPTDRSDARVRETFIEVNAGTALVPGLRVWTYCRREDAAGRMAGNG
jgi:multidrug resistance efflux pump